MMLTVTRKIKTETSLIGDLAIDGKRQCYTMERTDVAIPVGTYKVELTFSPHFHQLMPLIDVPGREGIRIHQANYPSHLEGCIAVGTSHDVDVLNNSHSAFEPVYKAISDAVNSWQLVQIQITEKY